MAVSKVVIFKIQLKVYIFPEPAGRGLLILRCKSHPPLCVGLVWFGRSTFWLKALKSEVTKE